MMKLIRACAPWLNWKIGALFVGVLLFGGLSLGQRWDGSPCLVLRRCWASWSV